MSKPRNVKQQDAKQQDIQQWDRLLKTLTQANPQDLVSWILRDGIYLGELNLELQKKAPIFADLLYTIKLKRKKVILHVEFQRQQDRRMGRRVWEYNCLASIHTGLPVYSVVIYLLKKGSIVDPPYEMKWPTGLTIQRFVFQNIKLWEIPGEALKQLKLPGLLPLLPLTKDGNRQEVVEEVIEGLEEAGRTDLLPLACLFAVYTFDTECEQQWLIERFNAMKQSLNLEDNYIYREMVKWAEEKSLKQGLEQGREQGLKQGLEQGLEQGKKTLGETVIRFVELYFPDLVLLAKKQAKRAKNAQQLQDLLNKLFMAHSDEEAKAVLLGKQL